MLDEPTRGFSTTEMHTRWATLQEHMRAENIDALLLTTEQDVRYVSGFLTPFWQSPTRTWSIVLPVSGRPVAVIATIGEPLMRSTPIEQIVTYTSPYPADSARNALLDVLKTFIQRKEAGAHAFRLGVPMGAETTIRMPQRDWQWLQSQCNKMTVIDATQVVQKTQRIKSAHEIDIIRYVAQLTSHVYAAMAEMLHTGMTEIEVFRTFQQHALEVGVDDVTYLVGGVGADGYRDIIGPPSTRKLTTGDVLILDSGCTRDGYYCDFDRNYSVGVPSQRVANAHHVVWDATEAGLTSVRPGETCQSVFNAMNSVMAPHATESAAGDVGRLGHGLGMQLTETPSFTAHDETLLETGMVLTLEPGYCYGDGHVMVHEENLVVTDTGYELLSVRATRDIMRIDP